MLLLVGAQRDQSLSPIQVAVGEQPPGVFGLHEDIEIRQIIGRGAKSVRSIQAKRNYHDRDGGGHAPRCRPQ